MKKYVISFIDLVKNFIKEFLLGETRVNQDLVKLTSDYVMVKDNYDEVMWGESGMSTLNKDATCLCRLSDLLVMVNTVRLEILDALSGSHRSTARSHVNAMLSELSDIQEEVEFLLSKHGIVHTQVIDPPFHNGMINYWRNMNIINPKDNSLLTLVMF